MIAVIAAYSVINFVVEEVARPKILGEVVGLSATITFLTLVFWAWAIGPLGLLLAVPLTLMVKALLVDADPNSRWIGALISAEPPPSQSVQVSKSNELS